MCKRWTNASLSVSILFSFSSHMSTLFVSDCKDNFHLNLSSMQVVYTGVATRSIFPVSSKPMRWKIIGALKKFSFVFNLRFIPTRKPFHSVHTDPRAFGGLRDKVEFPLFTSLPNSILGNFISPFLQSQCPFPVAHPVTHPLILPFTDPPIHRTRTYTHTHTPIHAAHVSDYHSPLCMTRGQEQRNVDRHTFRMLQ